MTSDARTTGSEPRLPAELAYSAVRRILSRLQSLPRLANPEAACRAILEELLDAVREADPHFLDGGSEAHQQLDGKVAVSHEFLGVVCPSLHEAIWQYAAVLVAMATNIVEYGKDVCDGKFLDRLEAYYFRLPSPTGEYPQWDHWRTQLDAERARPLTQLSLDILACFKGKIGRVMTGPELSFDLGINYATDGRLRPGLRRLVRDGFLEKNGDRGGYRLIRLPPGKPSGPRG